MNYWDKMIAKSKLRGHSIYTNDGTTWRYTDTDEPTKGNERPCGECGKENTQDGHDACIASMPGVRNACCGHGVEEDAYVQFENGREIRGEAAIVYFIKTGHIVR